MGWDVRDEEKCQGRCVDDGRYEKSYISRFRGISKDIRSRIFHLDCASPGKLTLGELLELHGFGRGSYVRRPEIISRGSARGE